MARGIYLIEEEQFKAISDALSENIHDATDQDCSRWEAELEEGLTQLTDKRRRFVETYIESGDALHAARDSGSEGESVQQYARRMMTDQTIKALIALQNKIRAHRAKVKAHEVIEELKKIAFADFNICEYDESGKPIRTRENKALWSCLAPKRRVIRRYKDRTEVEVTSQLPSKMEALTTLAKFLGLLDGAGADERQATPAVIVAGIDLGAITGRLTTVDAPALPGGASTQPLPLPSPSPVRDTLTGD